jgi:hypothetical protein
VNLEFAESLPAISKYIALQCPNIRVLKVGDMGPGMKLSYYRDQRKVKNWSIKTLEQLKSPIETLPQLSKVKWRKGRRRLCLADLEEGDVGIRGRTG